jgi:F-type H+-transporting ATPase subunit b
VNWQRGDPALPLFFAMSLPLILAAAADAHASASPGVVENLQETFGHFGVEWKYVLIQLFSFLVVLAVLYRFGIKPTIAAMDERTKKIEAGLKYADEMKAQLAATQQQNDAALREAAQKAQAIVAEAQKSAKAFADKQQQDAIEQSAALISKAREAIELEKKKMLGEARTEIARLVVTTTQRVLAKELSESERSRYNDAAARELTSV